MPYAPPAGTIFAYDDGAGAPQIITPYVHTIGDIAREFILEMGTEGFATAWEESLAVGKARIPPFDMEGLVNTAANSLWALCRRSTPDTPASTSRTFKVTILAGVTVEFETWVAKNNTKLDRGKLGRFSVTLQPTGAPTDVG